MSDGRSGLVIAGAVMMAASALVPFVLWGTAADGLEGLVGAIVFTFIFAPILFLVGLVLLIVGLVRGRRAGQQQQQQVVVVTGGAGSPASAGGGRFCTACGKPMLAGTKFCPSCGARAGG